jgi:hypothetical protein
MLWKSGIMRQLAEFIMDQEAELDTVLRSAEPDQRQFITRIMTVLGRKEWRKRHIEDPRNLYRALGYICSWVYYPEYPELLEKLPDNITKLHQQLQVSLQDLQPQIAAFYADLDDGEFSDIFTQPWAVALVLLVPDSAITLLNAAPLARLMPALLFILTYLPSQRLKISAYLGNLVQKSDGVYSLIQAFAKGEHKDILRDLAVKVLSALPKSADKGVYISSVLGQCIGLMLDYNCEAYFRCIVSDTAAGFIGKYAEFARDTFLSLLRPALSQPDISSAIRTLSALAARDPPPRLVLYLLEEQFPLLLALDTAASDYPALRLCSEVRSLLLQIAKYSDCAGSLLYEGFIVGQGGEIGFRLEGDRLIRSDREEGEEQAVRNLEHNISLLALFSQSPLSSKVCSQLFSLLLSEYVHSQSPLPLLYLASIGETLPAELLIQSAAQLSVFLRATLREKEEETWLLALELLGAVLECDLNALDKALLVDISKEVIALCAAEDPTLAAAAQRANSLISRSLLQSSTESSPLLASDLPAHLLSDLHSAQPFERAFALHHLSLLPPPQLQSPFILPELYKLLEDQDTFVFQNVLKLGLRLVKVRQKEVIEGVLQQYREMRSWVGKAHVLELIFHAIIVMGRVTVYTWAQRLMEFLTATEGDELLLNGKLSVLGELVKYLGPALHPYLWYIIGLSLSCVRTASSALYQHKPVPSSLAPALIILHKLLKNSPISHIQPRLEEVKSALSTLYFLCSDTTEERSLLVQAIDSAAVLEARQYGLAPID